MSNRNKENTNQTGSTSATMDTILGPTLLSSADNETPTSSALSDATIIALYFSASWCPPCKAFTPKLCEFYKAAKSNGLEIIFMSSDKDKSSFDAYFSKMPWLAIPFESLNKVKNISSKLKIRGIPSLIILDAKTGNFISSNGRNDVASVVGKSEASVKELIESWEATESTPLDLTKSSGVGCQVL